MTSHAARIPTELHEDYSLHFVYDIPGFPVTIRQEAISQFPRKRLVLHWHDDFEMMVIQKGQLCVHVNSVLIRVPAGCGIFINSRQTHFSYDDSGGDCQFIILQFSPSLLSTGELDQRFVRPVMENASLAWIFLDKDVLWQNQILQDIRAVLREKGSPVWQLTTLSSITDIWAAICSHTGMGTAKREDSDLTVLKNMVGFIQQNFPQRITLEDIAAAGFVSPSKCCRLFADAYQTSPVRYLQEYRLDWCSGQLSQTREPVTQIALSAGFSDVSYFSKCFRKWSGLSPREYREKTGNLVRLPRQY